MWGHNFTSDPFFQPHMNMAPPFGVSPFPQHPFLALQQPALLRPPQQPQNINNSDNRLARTTDPFMDPFAHMNQMMQQMSAGFGGGLMMPNMQQFGGMQGVTPGNSQCYSYSSVMSYSNTGGNNEPKVFEATTSMRQGPGGVKETRKTVRDSESGINKMAIGHHIDDRGHIIERSVNKRTNERNEHQNFVNMDENEVDGFNDEWSRATSNFNNPLPAIGNSRRHHRTQNGNNQRAIDN